MIGGPDEFDRAGLVAAGVVALVALWLRRRLGLVPLVLLVAPFAAAGSAYLGLRRLAADPADGIDLARYVQLVIAWKRAVRLLPWSVAAAGLAWWATAAWGRRRARGG